MEAKIIVDLLVNASIGSTNVKEKAAAKIGQLEEENLPGLLLLMLTECNQEWFRLYLENGSWKEKLTTKWGTYPDVDKLSLKSFLLENLYLVPETISFYVSEMIAKVASAEIPQGQWPDLFPNLMKGDVHLSVRFFSTVDCMCAAISWRDVNPNHIDIKSLLTVLKEGLNLNVVNYEVRVAATGALLCLLQNIPSDSITCLETHWSEIVRAVGDSLEVISEEDTGKVRFDALECLTIIASADYTLAKEVSRIVINLTQNALEAGKWDVLIFWIATCVDTKYSSGNMVSPHTDSLKCLIKILEEQLVGHISLSESKLRESGFQCLHQIAKAYNHLAEHCMDAVLNLTQKVVPEPTVDCEGLVFEAVEFWNDTLLLKGATLSMEMSLKLVPFLLKVLSKQCEDGVLVNKARTCLDLAAKPLGDNIVPNVLIFVKNNISKHPSVAHVIWCSFRVETTKKLRSIVTEGLNFLNQNMPLLPHIDDISIMINTACAFVHWVLWQVDVSHGQKSFDDVADHGLIMTQMIFRSPIFVKIWGMIEICHKNELWSRVEAVPQRAPSWLLPLTAFCPLVICLLRNGDINCFYAGVRKFNKHDMSFFVRILKEALWEILWVSEDELTTFDIVAVESNALDLKFLRHRVCKTATKVLSELQKWNDRKQYMQKSEFCIAKLNEVCRHGLDAAFVREAVNKQSRVNTLLEVAPMLIPFDFRSLIFQLLIQMERDDSEPCISNQKKLDL